MSARPARLVVLLGLALALASRVSLAAQDAPSAPTAMAEEEPADAPAPHLPGSLPVLLLDDLGHPCAAVTLKLEHRLSVDGSERTVTATTDPEGAAAVTLPQGEGALTVVRCERPAGAPPLATPDEDLAVDVAESGGPPLVIVMARCFPLEVTVRDHEGRPVTGAAVDCVRVESPDAAVLAFEAPLRTDAAGAVTIAAVPAGTREVTAFLERPLAVTHASVEVAGPAHLALALPAPLPPASLLVRFLDDRGMPATPTGVLVVRTSHPAAALAEHPDLPSYRERPLAGTESAVLLLDLVPGDGEVTLRRPVWTHIAVADAAQTVSETACDFPAGVTATIAIVVPRPGVLRGIVLRGDAPATDAVVRYNGRHPGGASGAKAPVDASGRFRIEYAGFLSVDAVVQGPEPATSRLAWVRLDPGEEREVVLRLKVAGTLSVRLLLEDGSLARGHGLTILSLEQPGDAGVWTPGAPRGRWSGRAPAGRCLVSSGRAARVVEVAEGRETQVDLVVEASPEDLSASAPPCSVTFRIVDGEDAAGPGDPGGVGRGWYVAFYVGGEEVARDWVQDGASLDLAPGRYEFLLEVCAGFQRDGDPGSDDAVTHPRGPAVAVELPAGGSTEVTLRATPACALVVSATGIPEPGTQAYVELDAVLPSGAFAYGRENQYEMREVAPGVHGVRIPWLPSGVAFRVGFPSKKIASGGAVTGPLSPGETRRLELEAVPVPPLGTLFFEGERVLLAELPSTESGVLLDPERGHQPIVGERGYILGERAPAGRYRVVVYLEDPRDGAYVSRTFPAVEVPAGGEWTLSVGGLLGGSSLTFFARGRTSAGRPLSVEGATLPPQPFQTNEPVRLERLPAGTYTIRVEGAVAREVPLAEGASVDLGIIEVP